MSDETNAVSELDSRSDRYFGDSVSGIEGHKL